MAQNESNGTSPMMDRENAVNVAGEILRDSNTGQPGKIGQIIDLADYIVHGDPYTVRLFRESKIDRDLASMDAEAKSNPEESLIDQLRQSAPDGVLIFSQEDLASGRVEETLRHLFNN